MTDSETAELLERWSSGAELPGDGERLAHVLADKARVADLVEDLRFDQALTSALGPLATVPRTRLHPRHHMRLRLAFSLAAAASILVFLSVHTWRAPADAGRLQSIVGEVSMVRDGHGRVAAVGLDLVSGDGIHVPAAGRATVVLIDGSDVTLEGGTDLVIAATAEGMRASLAHGELRVVAAHQRQGQRLVISTPVAEAIVVGTRFSLEHDGTTTRLIVEEGQVRLRRLADGATVPVAAHRQAKVVTGADGTGLPVEPAYDPPLRITAGGDYRGAWRSTDRLIPAVRIATREPVVIVGSWLSGAGGLIACDGGADVVIRDCHAIGERPEVAGRAPGRFVDAESPTRMIIENNEVDGTSGIDIHGAADAAVPRIAIRRNRVRDLDGRAGDGKGGWVLIQEEPTAHFVNLNGVDRAAGAEIAWNEVLNAPRTSQVSHVINIWGSGGSADQPLLIHDNYIHGAYPLDPARDVYEGGGICLGEGKPDASGQQPGFTKVYDNQLVDTVNHAIALFGGHDQEVWGNTAVSAGILPDGTPIRAQNTAFPVWDLARIHRRAPMGFSNNIVHDNLSGWVRWGTRGSPEPANFWFDKDADGFDCRDARSTGNRVMTMPITRALEDAEWQRWLAKVRDHGVTIGAHDAK